LAEFVVEGWVMDHSRGIESKELLRQEVVEISHQNRRFREGPRADGISLLPRNLILTKDEEKVPELMKPVV